MDKFLEIFRDRAWLVIALAALVFLALSGGDPLKLQAMWADTVFIPLALGGLALRRIAYRLSVHTRTHELHGEDRWARENVLIICDSLVILGAMIGSVVA